MKIKIFVGLLICELLFSSFSMAASRSYDKGEKKLGLGFILGSPTAITGKYWINHNHAYDFGLGYWFGSYVEFYGDYLWEFPRAFADYEPGANEFVPYFGVGGDFHIASRPPNNNDPSFGFYARIPLGLEWLPRGAPLGIFLEIVPGLSLVPGLSSYLAGGIGARFYF